MAEIRIDLHTDWANILRLQLTERGYLIPSSADNDRICLMYFNLIKRSLIERPRKVLLSKQFTCPPDIIDRFEVLKKKIEDGVSLKPHLSKRIADLDYSDPMLNDWAIYHLHLNTKLDSDGFTNRDRTDALNDFLLYARFDNDNAYLINIYGHGAWTKQEMIKIIHENWPDSIKSFLLEGVIEMEFNPSDDDIKGLRKSHLNTFVEVEKGIVYMPLGWGSSTDGTSSEIVIVYNKYMRALKRIEKSVHDNISKIEEKIRENGKEVPAELVFQLVIDDNIFYVNEKNTNLIFKM